MEKGKWFIALWITALIAACSPLVPTNEVRVAETISPTQKIVPSETNTLAQLPFPTATIFIHPTITSTWTPLPTLTTNEADKLFLTWLQGSVDCLFPCWAGITPGETRWEEAIHQLAPVLELHIWKDVLRCRFGECKNFTWQREINNNLFSGGMYNRENIIYSIFMEGDQLPKELSLQEVFKKYGIPENIFIITSPRGLAGDPPMFFLFMFYPRNKFVIEYRWEAQITDGNILACGKPEGYSLGIVGIDEDRWTEEEIYRTGSQIDNGTSYNSRRLRPIVDVTDLTVDDLFQEILKNKTPFCIMTPIEYWK